MSGVLGDRDRLDVVVALRRLAEIGVFADTAPALSLSVLVDAIGRQWPLKRIAAEHAVSVATVRIELHRHGLFDAHRLRHR